MTQYATEENKFHILSLPVDAGGCGWMRIRSPFREIKKQKLAEAEILDEGQLLEDEFKKVVAKADIIIARPGTYSLMKEVKELFPFKKIIVDFDDDVFNILPSSEHYKFYGAEDVIIPINGEDVILWKSGVNNFNKFNNMKRLVDLKWMIENATVVTAVTENLGKWLSEVSGKDVSVVPNFLDFSLYPECGVSAKDKKDGEFRIGFCGGASHHGDLQMIKKEMLKFLQNTPNATLHLIGQDFDIFDEAGEQVVKHAWISFEGNPFRMKMLDLDVLIAPLEENVFNIRKDPLKFWDASGLGVPLVASNISPFKDVMKDGETGFLFDTPEEFRKILLKLFKDRKLGKKIGKNARDYVYENRNLKKFAPKLVKFYQSIWKQKKS